MPSRLKADDKASRDGLALAVREDDAEEEAGEGLRLREVDRRGRKAAAVAGRFVAVRRALTALTGAVAGGSLWPGLWPATLRPLRLSNRCSPSSLSMDRAEPMKGIAGSWDAVTRAHVMEEASGDAGWGGAKQFVDERRRERLLY